ncbi:Helix-turn-helix domain-containing protein [Streptomyces sp. WMMB 714]|uniref:helix-turn-helix domain-containing protein n=1 Tax=Streptomyces sp. WMMB 714 TaxID=1286822 RepID=UPI0005F76E01|nr:helix-turn-helix transcriptional regulator [Streptomyces sp. WMMB 714]SCK44127.1 Helix-turn-helix domain-containing protein [Streptomyces sp. WMMB 714]
MTGSANAASGTNGEPEGSDGLKAFGAVLKAFRRRARLTQDELATRVRYSAQTIASVEQGRRLPPGDFVERAEELLDAFGALRAAAQHAVRRPGLASWFREWARLEEDAVSLCTYECRVIPGLLQTEAYARAVTLSVPPPPSAEEVRQRVAARLERQRLLRRDRPIAFSFIVEQALIERGTGGAEATEALIDNLLEVAGLWNVELQLMPLRQPWHAGHDGPMQLLETADNQWLGYTEGQETGQLIPSAKDVSVLFQRYARMRSQALTPEDSASLLRRMRGTL